MENFIWLDNTHIWNISGFFSKLIDDNVIMSSFFDDSDVERDDIL